jgi:hypothetical protein
MRHRRGGRRIPFSIREITFPEDHRRKNSREKQTLDLLIDADDVTLVGIVLAELLQGCRSHQERDELTEGLLALPYLGVTQFRTFPCLSPSDESSALVGFRQPFLLLHLSALISPVLQSARRAPYAFLEARKNYSGAA